MICNGDARLCDRKYSDVVFVGTHNSYALDGAGGLPGLANAASNQFINVPAQLGMGIRFLQSQTHVKDDSLHVCHTSCDLYDGGSLEDYLKSVSAFLNDDANKNEVVTLLITNPENYPIEKWADIFKAASLDSLVYNPSSVPGTRADWPTMRELISANTRVVVLMDYNADTTKVPWILPEFDLMWESKFDEVDASFPCGVDRVNGDAGPKLGMSLINHYLDSEFLGILIPDRNAAPTTNSVDSIAAQVNNCAALGEAFKVTHVLLDWADKGQAIEAGRKLNGLE
ncbi:PLC-like phosphodiesterase [Auriculariales sp. MPI-PUGE-AT-0066]|nr:PLC-like phosphodiesterase [Auriculariales sp. MPI-PUGE-AT-0066]